MENRGNSFGSARPLSFDTFLAASVLVANATSFVFGTPITGLLRLSATVPLAELGRAKCLRGYGLGRCGVVLGWFFIFQQR